jgi:hypothetical protein
LEKEDDDERDVDVKDLATIGNSWQSYEGIIKISLYFIKVSSAKERCKEKER